MPGNCQVIRQRKGTAVSNTCQKTGRRAQPDGWLDEIAVPEQVIVSMAGIAESAKEGLLALAAGTGLRVMRAISGEDAERLCGPAGKHNPDRVGYRHGSEAGSVTLGGRRLAVTRPRVRAAGGSGELHLPSYGLFSATEVLSRLAMEKMLAGLSPRRYPAGLERAGQAVESAAAATSKPAVPRRFVAATETGAGRSIRSPAASDPSAGDRSSAPPRRCCPMSCCTSSLRWAAACGRSSWRLAGTGSCRAWLRVA